jgi:hypothetical protein
MSAATCLRCAGSSLASAAASTSTSGSATGSRHTTKPAAVAVLGAAPGGGHTARDGTALAAAHAAGIAALIAISHPALRTSGGVRGVTKADLTGRLLLTGSRLVQVSTSGRVVCVPDASIALGLPGGVTPAMSMPTTMPESPRTYAIR